MAEERVKCLVLTVTGPAVVVPNAAVAELITQNTVSSVEGAPDWFLGRGSWRGLDIPLIAFDRLCGEREQPPPAAGRFVVLFGLEHEGAPAFYGIRIDRLPRSETVDRTGLIAADEPGHPSEYVALRARLGDRECLIPDFDALGRALAPYAPVDAG
ncbi:MAG: chemotaxis protein CheW [Halofilum sp. (in: g-proteobacteria)]|nr:chemotaxis protein CheW [Halofilum sp. (in: g-proteobacteria)]